MSAQKITATLAISGLAAIGCIAAAPVANAQTSGVARPTAITRFCQYTSSQPTLSYAPSTYKLAVKQLQCELNWSLCDTNLSEDGYFGSATLATVRTFQSRDQIHVDGIVGSQTWSELNWWNADEGCLAG
ncbi:Putative peptidoglycan binding domain-containing protein [Actinacidiphila yanglinensis]|uniref:Putative peptidoglycan binding domain-containing protein n=1 Tax=Actinacidiphila yanglinensis TaxID=310779 RepID=A0A1H6E1R7_9ACTN|nr:peptidoglycan-binding domain-containing protein [Actinacidiphila yanglinensis]SEG91289.1 Putative peptidoglycan binding domain-containing protein [Actinacidiphila yanglinensis]